MVKKKYSPRELLSLADKAALNKPLSKEEIKNALYWASFRIWDLKHACKDDPNEEEDW